MLQCLNMGKSHGKPCHHLQVWENHMTTNNIIFKYGKIVWNVISACSHIGKLYGKSCYHPQIWEHRKKPCYDLQICDHQCYHVQIWENRMISNFHFFQIWENRLTNNIIIAKYGKIVWQAFNHLQIWKNHMTNNTTSAKYPKMVCQAMLSTPNMGTSY